MSLDRTDVEYNPLSIDDDDVFVLRPRRQQQAFAKVFEQSYASLLILVILVIGLGSSRIGVNHPTATTFQSLVDM